MRPWTRRRADRPVLVPGQSSWFTCGVSSYRPSTYGDRIADVYDDLYINQMDPSAAVELLAQLADGGRALELGIGTGRVALPLAARGVDVSGIDASEEMVGKLRAKPGGDGIPVTMGDFADVDVEGKFALIYVPFTTFFALPSQAEQIRCLGNVSNHLEDHGAFVVEAFVPDLGRFRNNQATSVMKLDTHSVMLDVSRHDPVSQTITASHVVLSEGGVRLYPLVLRYAWPAELDAMALVAGLQLTERFGDYDRRSFDSASARHISVYRKTDAA